MRADLAQFFQIDIDEALAGRVPARHVNRLINHLTLMPQSRISAIDRGDIEWMGWDWNTSILASTHNLIAQLIAGLSKDVDLDALLIRPPGDGESGADQPKPPPTPQYSTIAEFIGGGGLQQLSNMMKT